jgi:hypothetical protein
MLQRITGAARLFGKNLGAFLLSAALRLRFLKSFLGAFLSALHGLRILLRTPRKGTAFGCPQTPAKGFLL